VTRGTVLGGVGKNHHRSSSLVPFQLVFFKQAIQSAPAYAERLGRVVLVAVVLAQDVQDMEPFHAAQGRLKTCPTPG
jgi:hypothetical protein